MCFYSLRHTVDVHGYESKLKLKPLFPHQFFFLTDIHGGGCPLDISVYVLQCCDRELTLCGAPRKLVLSNEIEN